MASCSSPPLPLLALTLFLFLFLHGHGVCGNPLLHGVQPISFEEGCTQIFGNANLALLRGGKRVHLSLDEATGAGFASQDLYLHGFFSAAIKLPADYAAGVVVAFYMSNGDMYQKTHDELDFEFLGNVRGREWRVQTNVYGNGSTHAGREERYDFWFDPTEDFHHYSIFWSHERIIFYIDETPIREVVRTEAMGAAFPSKPMSLYATIWDGSGWATLGGRYKVNYRYAPFVAEFDDLVLRGCPVDPTDHSVACEASQHDSVMAAAAMSPEQRDAMAAVRRRHMSYSYCHDQKRYPVALSECDVRPDTARLFGPDGLRYGDRRHRRSRSRRAEASM